MNKRLIIAAIGLVLALSACSQASTTPSSSGQVSTSDAPSPTPVALEPMAIGLSSDPTSLTVVAAVEQGFFEAHGIDASYQLFSSAGDAITATVAGDIQMAGTLSEQTALGTKAKGADIELLCIVDKSAKQVGLVATADITKPEDLIGKTVGTTFGIAAQFYQELYFDKYGLTSDQVEIVNVAPPDTVAALARNDIQAYFSFQPWLDRASEAVTGAHILNYSGDDGVYVLALAMAATSDWVASHPEEAKATMLALKDATDWINANKADAIQLTMRVYQLEEASATSIVNNQEYVMASPEDASANLNKAADFIVAHDIAEIDDPPTFVDEIINADPYDAALGQ